MTMRNSMGLALVLALAAVSGTGSAAKAQSAGQAGNPAMSQAGSQAGSQARLPQVLARLDKASANFHSATAKFHKELYTSLVKSTETQDGTLYIQRKGSVVTVGVRRFSPDAMTLNYANGVLRMYTPATDCLQEVAASSPGQAETFLTLGFGGSGADLQRNWQITDQGQETLQVDDRRLPVERLDLVPKDPAVRNNVTHVMLWVDLDRGIAVKQELWAPTGDTQTATYSDIKVNTAVDLMQYTIPKKPKGCRK